MKLIVVEVVPVGTTIQWIKNNSCRSGTIKYCN